MHTGDGFIVEVLIGTQQQLAKKLIGNGQFSHFLKVLKNNEDRFSITALVWEV